MEEITLGSLAVLEILTTKYAETHSTNVVCHSNMVSHTEWFLEEVGDLNVEGRFLRNRFPENLIQMYITSAFMKKEPEEDY